MAVAGLDIMITEQFAGKRPPWCPPLAVYIARSAKSLNVFTIHVPTGDFTSMPRSGRVGTMRVLDASDLEYRLLRCAKAQRLPSSVDTYPAPCDDKSYPAKSDPHVEAFPPLPVVPCSIGGHCLSGPSLWHFRSELN